MPINTCYSRVTVDLPKKHGRGGQSALRFARLRLEKRHNYLRKVAELAVQFFITNDRVSTLPRVSITLFTPLPSSMLTYILAQRFWTHRGWFCRLQV